MFCRMGSRNGNEAEASQRNAQDPPGPPTLADAIANLLTERGEQTRLLNLLIQNQENALRPRPGSEMRVTYSQFLETRLPIFMKPEHPLEADEWIRTIE